MHSEGRRPWDNQPTRQDRPFQFTLRGAMTVMTACCLLFALVGSVGLLPLFVLTMPLAAVALVGGVALLVTRRMTQLLNWFKVSESTVVHAGVAALVFIAVAAWIILVFARPT